MAYNQEQKNTVPEETLKNAIEALTNNEKPATLIDKGYVRRVRDYLLENGSSHDKSFASKLSDDALLKWENYFELNNRTKKCWRIKSCLFFWTKSRKRYPSVKQLRYFTRKCLSI